MAQTKIISGYPALVVESDKKSLVITDLHLGFENNLALNNVFLGKNKTVNKITDEILSELVKFDAPIKYTREGKEYIHGSPEFKKFYQHYAKKKKN